MEFQSTHPVWGATPFAFSTSLPFMAFQSTHPVWGATRTQETRFARSQNFNPRTPCGVRRVGSCVSALPHPISIHAPRVGCDFDNPGYPGGGEYFNPRTPCGVRHAGRGSRPGPERFQSTHPVWGATGQYLHAARLPALFQSTHPVWGATSFIIHNLHINHISIHAPRVGCDMSHKIKIKKGRYFNPRTPCGVRLDRYIHLSIQKIISIHAPRVGCDKHDRHTIRQHCKFQSTHPVWGATQG